MPPPLPPTHPRIDLKNRYLAAGLAWLIPGLGHLYQGRTAKAVTFFVAIMSLYVAGMIMGEGHVVYWRWVNPLANSELFCLSYLGQFFVGLPAFPALVQATLKHYDKAPILWDILAEPPREVSSSLLDRLGKVVEMAYLYTEVAGLLNLLAIFDAFEGPATDPIAAEADAEPAR